MARQWQAEAPPIADLEVLQSGLAGDLARYEAEATGRAAALQARVQKVKRERFKWAEKAMSGAAPDDIAAEKQRLLAGQLSSAEVQLAQHQRLGDVHRQALGAVVALIADAGQTCAAADPQSRRGMNQAWFAHLEIDEDDDLIEVVRPQRDDFPEAVRREIARREEPSGKEKPSDREGRRVTEPVGVSNLNLLVVLTRLPSKHLTALVNAGAAADETALPQLTTTGPARARRLSAADQVAVLRAYQAGDSMAALAARFDVRRSTISELLRRSASPMRAERAISDDDVDQAVWLYDQGQSLVRIGERLGYNAETIRKQLKRRGVVMRPASQPGARVVHDVVREGSVEFR